MSTFEPLLESSVEISAPPTLVWELVHDVRRMAEWSPQVAASRLRAGHPEVELGAQFTNLNRHGELEWTTHGEIVRFVPTREMAFRIAENRVIWAFVLVPLPAGGTRLTQRRETPEGISERSLRLTDDYMGGQEVFTRTMGEGMRATLEEIRTAAEREAPAGRGLPGTE